MNSRFFSPTAFLMAGVAMLANPLLAQTAGGREIDTGSIVSNAARAQIPNDKRLNNSSVREITDQFGKCMIGRFRGTTLKALTFLPGSPRSAAALQSLDVDECLGSGEIRMSPDIMRGSLYRALYVADFHRVAPQIRPEQIDFTQGQAAQGDSSVDVLLRKFSDCVLRLGPAQARSLVLASAGSEAESAALAAVSPNLGSCLAPRSTIKFSKAVLIGLISEVLYRDSLPGTTMAAVGVSH